MKFIPLETTLEEVREKFEKVGKIISIKLDTREKTVQGNTVKQYQYAYILYEKHEEAQQAIKKYDIKDLFGPRPISVSLWESKV